MSAESVGLIPRCAECEAVWLPADEERWRAHLPRAGVELVADHDKADGHPFDEALLRCGVGRARLDEPFLFFRTNRNDDFVRRKRRKGVADGETDVRFPGTSFDGLAGKLLGRVFSDALRMTDRFLVVCEPVEHALPSNRHHDLDRLGLPDVRAQYLVRMFAWRPKVFTNELRERKAA